MTTPVKAEPAPNVVAPIRRLLRDREAALAVGRSVAWIRAKRAADKRAREEGRAMTGPKWVTIGPSVFYRVSDVDEWIAANAVECGAISFANRGGTK